MQSEFSLALVPYRNNKLSKPLFSQTKIPFPTSSGSDTDDEDHSPRRDSQKSQLEQAIDDIAAHKCSNGEYVFLGGSYKVAWDRVINFYRRYKGAPFSQVDCVKVEVMYDIDEKLRTPINVRKWQDYEFLAFIATCHTSKEGRKTPPRVTDPSKVPIDVYRIYLDRYENVSGVIKAT